MTTFIKADIFFFVTTIAVVCLTLVVSVAIWYASKILKEVLEIARKAKGETDNVIADVRDLRMAIREEGTKLKFISEMLTQFAPKPKTARPKKKAHTTTPDTTSEAK